METKFTPEVLTQKAHDALEAKKSPEAGEQKLGQLTVEEKEAKEHIQQVSDQSDATEDKAAQQDIFKSRRELLSLNDDRAQLTELIKLCFVPKRGPRFAIKVARSLSPAVLDSLHDVLAKDEVYKQLEEKHLI